MLQEFECKRESLATNYTEIMENYLTSVTRQEVHGRNVSTKDGWQALCPSIAILVVLYGFYFAKIMPKSHTGSIQGQSQLISEPPGWWTSKHREALSIVQFYDLAV